MTNVNVSLLGTLTAANLTSRSIFRADCAMPLPPPLSNRTT